MYSTDFFEVFISVVFKIQKDVADCWWLTAAFQMIQQEF